MMSPDIQRKLNDCSICFIICVNSEQYENLEEMLAKFHLASSALIFNSGYDANVGETMANGLE